MTPIFIIGVGRSGTSLLQSMLAAHSKLSFLPETGFIRNYIAKKKIQNSVRKKGINFTKELICSDSALSRVDFDFTKCIDSNKNNIDLDCYLAMQDHGMNRTEKTRFGDKDPRLIEYLPTVKACFPDAYIVNIVRDPRDVLNSKKKAAWSAGRSLLFYTFANRVQLRIARLFGKNLFGERYIEIIYEDLIRDPVRQLENLCLKLDLEFESNLLNFGKYAKQLVSTSEFSWKKETLGPLLPDNSNKWVGQLSDEEVALTELCCSDAFAVGGYTNTNAIEKLTFLSKLSIYIQHTIIASATPLYIAIRNYRQKH